MDNNKSRKATFNIDGGTAYPGYTSTIFWNGWACPGFTKKTAMQIIRDFSEESSDLKMEYVKETDTFIVTGAYDEPEEYRGYNVRIKGRLMHLYDLGGCCWCWEMTSDA